jgi:hypothetical protein
MSKCSDPKGFVLLVVQAPEGETLRGSGTNRYYKG